MNKNATITETLNHFFNPNVVAIKPVKIADIDEAFLVNMDNDSVYSVWFVEDADHGLMLRVRIHKGKTARSEVIWGSELKAIVKF